MTMSPTSPYPLPLTISPASQPAIAPMMIITISAVTQLMPTTSAVPSSIVPLPPSARPAPGRAT